MHNLAIALHKKGDKVTGSDDEIFEPSKSRLEKYGLLPKVVGWDESNITKNIDAVILGMHARNDNPELLKAQKLGLKIFSYSEYLYEHSKNKIRIVIGGSHGKTSITAMILHVLNICGVNTDYMVGAQLEGFDVMVKLSDDSKYIVLEGDEYLTSPIDLRPKFHLYKPDIALISGIAWDHINVFPTFDKYTDQFRIFANLVPDNGALIYTNDDIEVVKIIKDLQTKCKKIPYSIPDYEIINGITNIIYDNEKVPILVFGKHNLLNIEAARHVCNLLNISNKLFYDSIKLFKGASKRLELVFKSDKTNIFKDFAHSPSKLKATTLAVKEQFPDRKLVACMELHTFSSLNKAFLNQYNSAMNNADEAIVYYNPHTIEHKKLEPIDESQIKEAFGNEKINVFTDSNKIVDFLMNQNWSNKNLLLMSSGNFDGIDFKELATKIINK